MLLLLSPSWHLAGKNSLAAIPATMRRIYLAPHPVLGERRKLGGQLSYSSTMCEWPDAPPRRRPQHLLAAPKSLLASLPARDTRLQTRGSRHELIQSFDVLEYNFRQWLQRHRRLR